MKEKVKYSNTILAYPENDSFFYSCVKQGASIKDKFDIISRSVFGMAYDSKFDAIVAIIKNLKAHKKELDKEMVFWKNKLIEEE